MAREKKHGLGNQGMVIDVDEYVDHFYIHYKTQTASHLARKAQEIFNTQRTKALSQARGIATEQQLNAMLAAMDAQTPAAASAQKIVDSLMNGQLLEQSLDSIANAMNASIERAYGNEYNSTIDTVQSTYNSTLKTGGMGAGTAAAFFNEIDKALQLIGEHMNSKELSAFKALQKVFATGSGWTEELVPVSEDSVTIASQVIKYLSNAAEKLSSQGSLSTQGFASTISQIFSTTIGEELARQMIQTALWDIEEQSDAIMEKGLSKLQGKATWADVRQAGTDRTKSQGKKRTSKVDVVTNNVFNLTTMINGNEVIIEVGTNASVKWQQSKNNSIHIVSRAPLQSALENMELDNNGMHIAYNVIAHRYSPNYPTGSTTSRQGNFYQAYNSIRGAIAGSFFTEWLTGSGGALSGGGIDKAQFLMYNGKIYSVMSIINRICEDVMKGRDVVTDISGINKVSNKFLQGPVRNTEDLYKLATTRSEMVRKAINALTITGSLNTEVLKGL